MERATLGSTRGGKGASTDNHRENAIREKTEALRDLAVRTLVRLSLIAVLGLMSAMFVGSAAQAHPGDGHSASSVSAADQVSVFHGISTVGAVLGAVLIGGGFVVLGIGAIGTDKRRPEVNVE